MMSSVRTAVDFLGQDRAAVSLYRAYPHCLAPVLRLVGVKELLSIGESARADLINSTRVKLLFHKSLCCLMRTSLQESEGVTEAGTKTG